MYLFSFIPTIACPKLLDEEVFSKIRVVKNMATVLQLNYVGAK